MSETLRGRYRQATACHYCGGGGPLTIDHIVPRRSGGGDAAFNTVPACGPCNQAKGDQPPTCTCGKCSEAQRLHALWLEAEREGWDRQTWTAMHTPPPPYRSGLTHHMDLSAQRKGLTA